MLNGFSGTDEGEIMSESKSCCSHDSDCAVHNAPAIPVGPCDCGETLKKLISASAMLRCLPENPGYNGSALFIDDTEAARIEKDIDEGVRHIQAITRQLAEATAERDALLRGEYICQQCGLRKNDDHSKGDF